MNLNFELYRTFCKVVKCDGISKAADELFVSQSAVTQAIQKLEKILGERLFFRNKAGIELTDLGQNLYNHICESVEVLENAEDIFANYSSLNKGNLRVAGGNTLLTTLLLNPICEFSQKYPNIKIGIYNGFTDTLIEKLSRGELDVVTVNLPYKGKMFSNVEIIPIRSSRYCLFASNEYYKEHKIKSADDIKRCKLILPNKVSSRYKIFQTGFKDLGFDAEATFEASSSAIVKKFVLNNMGIGFSDEESIKDIMDKIKIIKAVKFEDESQGIVVLNKSSQNKVTREFLKMVLNKNKQN